jgi:hypothetical protein
VRNRLLVPLQKMRNRLRYSVGTILFAVLVYCHVVHVVLFRSYYYDYYLESAVDSSLLYKNASPLPYHQQQQDDSIRIRSQEANEVAASTSTIQAAIEPLWNCPRPNDDSFSSSSPFRQHQDTNSKFLFVHVFKTAGTTLRALLGEYAADCQKSYGIVAACTGVPTSSLLVKEDESDTDTDTDTDTNVDRDRDWKHCILTDVMDRQGNHTAYGRTTGKMNNRLLSHDLDIIGGHWRLGSADHLQAAAAATAIHHGTGSSSRSRTLPSSSSYAPLNLRHVAFFRNAAAKYVSGIVYVKLQKRRYTLLEMIEVIQKEVTSNLRHGRYHDKYSNYLLTPWQAKEVVVQKRPKNNTTYTRAEINAIMKQNLVHYNVTIGMVERMPESMQILRHVLDHGGGGGGGGGTTNGTSSELFDRYAGGGGRRNTTTATPTRNTSTRTKRNQSGSSKLLKQLQDNADFYPQLLEYVKYEQEITDFAMRLHQRQYQAILRHRHRLEGGGDAG